MYTCIIFLITSTVVHSQNETPPKRTTFTFPTLLEGILVGLDEADLNIVYGPNSVPPPDGISEEAKKAWANLPQVPLLADDLEKLAAVRKFTFLFEDIAFEKGSFLTKKWSY